MVYALNLFDIVDGEEGTYREYMRATASVFGGIDAEPVLACRRPKQALRGQARECLVVMKFASVGDFETMIERQDDAGITELRERSTENYIWTLYDEWDLGTWLEAGQS